MLPALPMPGGAAGRFAFVEFRTRELTDAAIQLDKLELCGRQMNIGRPKGYVVSAGREPCWCVLPRGCLVALSGWWVWQDTSTGGARGFAVRIP